MASIAKVVIAESRAFPEIGRFYLKEVIGRGIPMFEGLIARGVDKRRVPQGRSHADRALADRADAAQHHLEDGVRADRRGEARCARPRPPSRRPDAACAEADHETHRPPSPSSSSSPPPLVAGICWRAPLLAALGFGGEHARYLGYVEGETSLIAPPVAGRLVERPVDRGGQVKKGDRLFVIDPVLAKAEVARTEGALAEAQSRYENLLKGKRPEEKDVTRAPAPRDRGGAGAWPRSSYKRQSELLAKGVGTRKDYEQAESQMRQLRSRAASLTAQEKVSELAARPDEIAAAKAQVDQNQANLDQARKRLDDLMPGAPEDGLIENTFFNVGEWVPAGTPVVSLLPPFRVKLRFFVPQEDVAQAKMGQHRSASPATPARPTSRPASSTSRRARSSRRR